jgi:hypothetical protein
MDYTIVEITDINGSTEKGIVYKASDLVFARDSKDTAKIEIDMKGDNWAEVADFLGIEYTKEVEAVQYKKDGCIKKETILNVTYLRNGKVRIDTGIADWKGRAQNIKNGANGNYINVFNQRWYID